MGICHSDGTADVVSEESFEGLRSSSAIASRLRHVLDAAHRILNEETLPVLDTVRVVRKIMRVSKAMRLENPEVITEECRADGCKPMTDVQEARQLASYVYHAQLVYEAETDQIRERLIGCGMMLIQHNKEINTGRVANYLAIDPRRKIAVLAIKGTSTIEDALTDIIADTGPLHLLNAVKTAGSARGFSSVAGFAHGGFRLAAHGVLHQVEPVIWHFLCPLQYQLILTGHSLGAGTACCLAKILYDRIYYAQPQLLRCFAYATPPCLDKATALSMVRYTVSVVHHDDLVTRASLYNAKLMSNIWREAKRLMDADEFEDCDKYGLVHRYQHEIKVDLKDDLYVAGKVMYVYKLGYPKGQDPITYKAVTKDGTMARLRCASFSRSSLTDHLCNHYTACTGEVAAQLSGTSPEHFKPWLEETFSGQPIGTSDCTKFCEDIRFSCAIQPSKPAIGCPVTLPTLLKPTTVR